MVALCLCLTGCFSADNFNPENTLRGGTGSCLGECAANNGDIRTCLNGTCQAPFRLDLGNDQPPLQDNQMTIVNLTTEPVVRLTSSYIADMLSKRTPDIDFNRVIVLGNNVLLEGSPETMDINAPRYLSVNPDQAEVIHISAQNIWIRRDTVFRSTIPGRYVVFNLEAENNIYVDSGVQTNDRDAYSCPCLSSQQIITINNSSIDDGHNCPQNVPSCNQL